MIRQKNISKREKLNIPFMNEKNGKNVIMFFLTAKVILRKKP